MVTEQEVRQLYSAMMKREWKKFGKEYKLMVTSGGPLKGSQIQQEVALGVPGAATRAKWIQERDRASWDRIQNSPQNQELLDLERQFVLSVDEMERAGGKVSLKYRYYRGILRRKHPDLALSSGSADSVAHQVSPVAAPEQAAPKSGMTTFCTSCGSVFDSRDSFCTRCGTRR